MALLSIDMSGVPSYQTFPAHDALHSYMMREFELCAVALGVQNPPVQPGGEWDLSASMFATFGDVMFANIQLSNNGWDPLHAEDTDLDNIRDRMGLPVLDAVGAVGYVIPTTTGLAQFIAGDECVFPGGLRGAVTADTSVPALNSPESASPVKVPISMIDTGTVTRFAAGTTCAWRNPPANAFVKAVVDANGFTGGTDTESDAAKRLRILEALQLPQLYGTLQWIGERVLEFPTSQYPGTILPDSVYVYRGPGGPGTFLVVVLKSGTAANQGDRTVPDATLAALRTYLSGLVPPEVHFDVRTPIPTPTNVALQVAWTGASGKSNWADVAPWPLLNPAGGQSYVTFTGVSGSTLTGVTATTAPSTGAKIRIWDPTGPIDLSVLSSSGSSGAYSVICASPIPSTVQPGDYLYPQVEAPGDAVEDLWTQAMGLLACGELTLEDRLPQCRRFPGIAQGGRSPNLYGAISTWVSLLDGAAVNAVSGLGGASPITSYNVAMAPFVLTTGRLGIYPLVGS